MAWKTPPLQQQGWSITPRFAQEDLQSPEGCCRPVSLSSLYCSAPGHKRAGKRKRKERKEKERSFTKDDTDQIAGLGLSSGDPTGLQNLHGVQLACLFFFFYNLVKLFSSGNVGS